MPRKIDSLPFETALNRPFLPMPKRAKKVFHLDKGGGVSTKSFVLVKEEVWYPTFQLPNRPPKFF